MTETLIFPKRLNLCPDCNTILNGDEVICPSCLGRLPDLETVTAPTGKRTVNGNSSSNITSSVKLSPAQQIRLRFQLLPWRRILWGSLLFLLLIGMLGGAIVLVWSQSNHNPPSSQEQLAEADRLYTEQNFEQAIVAYKQFLEIYPNSAPAYNGLGWSYYQLGQDKEAYAAFRQATNLAPGMLEAQMGLGQTAYYLRIDGEAITALNQATQLNPRKADAFGYLGSTYFRQGRYADAINSLEQAIHRNPNDIESLATLGHALVLTNQPAEAITPLERAINLNFDNENIRQYLAKAYMGVGRYDEAVRHLRIALNTNPDNLGLRHKL